MAIKVSIIQAPEGTAQSVSPRFHDHEYQVIERIYLAEGVWDKDSNGLKVSEESAGANMTVDVAAGRALIEITNTLTDSKTYKVWFVSDAVTDVSVPTADGTHERIDRIIAKVDVSTAPNATASNVGTIELVQGTPDAAPTAPATPANAISLATISVPASDTTISNAQITDTRTEIDLAATDHLPAIARSADLNAENDSIPQWLTSVAGTNTITASVTPTRTAYAAGQTFRFKVANDNTGATTLNVDSIGAKTIKKVDGATDLSSGDLQSGQTVEVVYDGTNFMLTSPIGQSAPGAAENIGHVSADSSDVGASSTSENTVSPTWSGSNDIGSSLLSDNDQVMLDIGGVVYVSSGSFCRVRVIVGGTLIGYATLNNDDGAERPWRLTAMISVRAVGASGSLIAQGELVGNDNVNEAKHLLLAEDSGYAPLGAITKDTTGALAITVTAQFGASNASHKINIKQGMIQRIISP